VVIVGGGIIGSCAALELAERGLSVVVCEKGVIAGEQSGRNWGWCRQMGRDPREIPLIIESLRLWRGMNDRVGAETGFRPCGIVYLCDSDDERRRHERWLETWARPSGIDSRMIDPARIDALLPGASSPWRAALHTPSDGRAEPRHAAPAIAAAARRLGAVIVTGCAVRGVTVAGGRVDGVVTEHGPVRAATVVVAGGAWSRRFLGNAGIRLPQLTVVNSVIRTTPLDAGIDTTFAGDRFAVRRRLDGGYTVAHNQLSVADITTDAFRQLADFLPALRVEWKGLRLRLGRRFLDEARLARRWALDETSPFERVRILDPLPVDAIVDQAWRHLRARYPSFLSATIAERWAGCIDVTPDAVPVISAVDAMPGLFVATGFSGHGFGIGPGAGRLLADLVTGEPPLVDPAPFRFARFSDGTRPRPETGF
jgi:glycine/D-amino acid oxidase-like deaminating enzyme